MRQPRSKRRVAAWIRRLLGGVSLARTVAMLALLSLTAVVWHMLPALSWSSESTAVA